MKRKKWLSRVFALGLIFMMAGASALVAVAEQEDTQENNSVSSQVSSSQASSSSQQESDLTSSVPPVTSPPPSSTSPVTSAPPSSSAATSAPVTSNTEVQWSYQIKADGKNITNMFVRNGTVITGKVANDVKKITVTAATQTSGAKISVSPQVPVMLQVGKNNSVVTITITYNGKTTTYAVSAERMAAASVSSGVSSVFASSDEPDSSEPVSSAAVGQVSSESPVTSKPNEENVRDSSWMTWLAVLLFILGAGGIGYVIYDQFFHGKNGPGSGGGKKNDAPEEVGEEETYDIMNDSGNSDDAELSGLYAEEPEEEVKAMEIQDDWGKYFK